MVKKTLNLVVTEIREDDCGAALIAECIEKKHQGNLFIRIHSWDESHRHLDWREAKLKIGTKIKVVIGN